MLNITPAEIEQRLAAADSKKCIGEATGTQKFVDEAELDRRFIEVMQNVIFENKGTMK